MGRDLFLFGLLLLLLKGSGDTARKLSQSYDMTENEKVDGSLDKDLAAKFLQLMIMTAQFGRRRYCPHDFQKK